MYFVTLMTPGQEYKMTKITFSHIISPHLHCHLLGKHYAASHLAGWKNTYLFSSLAKIFKKDTIKFIRMMPQNWCVKLIHSSIQNVCPTFVLNWKMARKTALTAWLITYFGNFVFGFFVTFLAYFFERCFSFARQDR